MPARDACRHVVLRVRAGRSSRTLRPIGRLVVPLLQAELVADGLSPDALGALRATEVVLARTADRSVLGSMNDMALMIESSVWADGGLRTCNVTELNRHLAATSAARAATSPQSSSLVAGTSEPTDRDTSPTPALLGPKPATARAAGCLKIRCPPNRGNLTSPKLSNGLDLPSPKPSRCLAVRCLAGGLALDLSSWQPAPTDKKREVFGGTTNQPACPNSQIHWAVEA